MACPHCAKTLDRNVCLSCNKPVQPEWVACPACGARLARRNASAGGTSSVTEEEVFEWMVHDDEGPSLDSDDAVDAAESIASSFSADQFALLQATFAWLQSDETGPQIDADDAMDHARRIAENCDEKESQLIRQVCNWLVSEDGPEMEDEDGLAKAFELIQAGMNMKMFDLLRRKFEWAHTSDKGPEWDAEQALAWALSKVMA